MAVSTVERCETFLCDEVSRITGTGLATRARWEKRGLLRMHGFDHSRYTPWQIASVLVCNQVAALRGHRLGHLRRPMAELEYSVVFYALSCLPETVRVVGTPRLAAQYRSELHGRDWSTRLELTRADGPEHIKRFLVLDNEPGGRHQHVADVAHAFHAGAPAAQTVIDLVSLGVALALRSKRPLFTVMVSEKEEEVDRVSPVLANDRSPVLYESAAG